MGMFWGLFARGKSQARAQVKDVGGGDSPFPVQQSAFFDLPRATFKAKTYNNFAAGYGENVYLYRAVDYVATACAGIKLELFTDRTKKRKLDSHPFLDLLNRPHDGASQTELIKEFVSYSILAGNAYLYAVNVQNKPRQIWSLRPDLVDITYNSYGQKTYTYNNGGTWQALDIPQILHLKMFNPTSDLYGLSPVSVAAALIEQYNSGTLWNVALMQNAGRPSGALISQATLGDASYLNLKQQIEEAYSGPAHAGRPLLLDGGLDWKQFSLSPIELDWLKSKEALAREIALAIGVPPELLGDSANKTHANYKESRASFLIETVLPLMDLIMSKFNAWLPVLYGDSSYLDYNRDDIEALQEDRGAIITQVNQQFTTGYITANEARKATGYDELAGFDFIITSDKKMIQAKDVAEYTANNAKPPAPPAPPVLPGISGPQPDVGNNQGTPAPEDTPPANENNQPKKSLSLADIKALNLSTEEKSLYWQSFETKRENWYITVEKQFQGYFQAQEKQVLAALNKAALPETIALHIENVLSKNDMELTKLFAQTYMAVGADFGDATYNAIRQRVDKKALSVHTGKPGGSQPFDVWSSIIATWLKNDAGTKITSITNTTRQNIRDRLAAGVVKGENIYQLADRIRGLYAEYYKKRSQAIARTEVISASNLGAIAGAVQTGLPLKKEWISTRDTRTREAHVQADGQIVGQHDPFTVWGEKLNYPGDIGLGASPQNTIQCRCAVGFRYDEDEDSDTSASEAASKHLPGRHDQRAHGRRYASVGGRDATSGYLDSNTGHYFYKKTVKEAVQQMRDKYPHIQFEFSDKCDVQAVNETLKEADRLLTRFPEVAQTISYVGDSRGGNSPQDYKNVLKRKGFQYCGAFAALRYDETTHKCHTAIVMNPKTMDKPPMKSTLESYNPTDTSKRYNVDYTHETIITHEFGHAIHNYLRYQANPGAYSLVNARDDGSQPSKVQKMVDRWSKAHRERGNKVSVYASTNEAENFAEGFLALAKLPPKKWPQFSWEQRKLLEAFLSENQENRLTIYPTLKSIDSLPPKKQQAMRSKLNKIYSYLGIDNVAKGASVEIAVKAADDNTELDDTDGFERFPAEGGGFILIESAPLGGPITDAWLTNPNLYKPDSSGDLTDAEVEALLTRQGDDLHELFHALSDPDGGSDDEESQNKHLPGRHDQLTHGNRRTFKPDADMSTFAQRKDVLTKQHEKWAKTLEPAENSSIRHYTGHHYQEMNDILRRNKPITAANLKYAQQNSHATAGLLKGRAPSDFVGVRMVSKNVYDTIAQHEGKYYRDKGFGSVSINHDFYWKETRIYMHIFKGAPGAYVQPFSYHPNEEEFLLPPGATYKVVKKGIDTDGKPMLVVEYRGTTLRKKKTPKKALPEYGIMNIVEYKEVNDMVTDDDREEVSQEIRLDRFTWDTLDGLEFLTDEEAAEYEKQLEEHPVSETEGPFPTLVIGDNLTDK